MSNYSEEQIKKFRKKFGVPLDAWTENTLLEAEQFIRNAIDGAREDMIKKIKRQIELYGYTKLYDFLEEERVALKS